MWDILVLLHRVNLANESYSENISMQTPVYIYHILDIISQPHRNLIYRIRLMRCICHIAIPVCTMIGYQNENRLRSAGNSYKLFFEKCDDVVG